MILHFLFYHHYCLLFNIILKFCCTYMFYFKCIFYIIYCLICTNVWLMFQLWPWFIYRQVFLIIPHLFILLTNSIFISIHLMNKENKTLFKLLENISVSVWKNLYAFMSWNLYCNNHKMVSCTELIVRKHI